jgi:hypothetical protein
LKVRDAAANFRARREKPGRNMDWYLYAKLLHIVFATFWIGGGMAMILLGIAAAIARDDDRLIHVVQQVVFLAERMFIPSSVLTVIFGATMAWMIQGFGELWIILGLAGFAATFCTGVFLIKPASDRVAAMVAKDGRTPAAAAICRHILRISIFDYVMILLVVVVMVLKPTGDDTILLGVMAAILAIGALLAFGGWRGGASAARA